ncbi:DUF349 domain-containing protein [Candidatus Rhodoluna planktonica]|uniref:DUF349 domain-containing protein n=1 Tax=Candidatus Rhodoluna planktonica TaxID=535712 RepID=UPI0008D924A9|nr:DUF349 domain-containing protein [Candidatus Rhodoluna planktonica]
MSTPSSFGRVDAENNVFVIEGATERKVGQYPGVSPEEALGYFTRKFDDFEAQVRILEQRVKANADAASLEKIQAKLTAELVEPAAVGDLASLRARVAAQAEKIASLSAAKQEQNKEAIAAALEAKTKLVESAEAIANKDPEKIIWKTGSAELAKLFEEWQSLQKNGPRTPKAASDALWKRFSSARTKFEAGKRAYFAGLDSANKAAKAKKSELVAKAEALVARGGEAASDYRNLLDDWKKSGRSASKADDALWARFKSAGDAIYAAKSELDKELAVEQQQNLAAKRELLESGKNIDPTKDLAKAKNELVELLSKWEKVGRVPRENIREIEDGIRAIERRVKDAEAEQWRKTDPAAIERANSLQGQLESAISTLESKIAGAATAKNSKLEASLKEELATKKAWLEVVVASAK